MPQTRDPPLYWLNWSGAASAFVVSVGIGVFNTTLHDEHGLLAFIFLGIWLSYRPRAAHPALPVAGVDSAALTSARRA